MPVASSTCQVIFAILWRAVRISWSCITVSVNHPHTRVQDSYNLQPTASAPTSALRTKTHTTQDTARNTTEVCMRCLRAWILECIGGHDGLLWEFFFFFPEHFCYHSFNRSSKTWLDKVHLNLCIILFFFSYYSSFYIKETWDWFEHEMLSVCVQINCSDLYNQSQVTNFTYVTLQATWHLCPWHLVLGFYLLTKISQNKWIFSVMVYLLIDDWQLCDV